MRNTIIALTALMLAACSSAEERVCRASLDETLINPETAEYSAFHLLNPDDIKNEPTMAYRREAMSHLIPQKGARYALMKVRAEGKLGNKITSNQFCAINATKDTCFCIEAE